VHRPLTGRPCARAERLPPLALAVAMALALVAAPARATLCLVATTPVAFGLYDTLLSGNNETTGQITVTCTPGIGDPLTTPYTVTLAGSGTGGDTVRSIAMGANRLYYQVYKDAARSVVWGNGGGSGSGVAGSTVSAASLVPALRVHTAYARMPANQRVPAGIYAGSLLVSVDY